MVVERVHLDAPVGEEAIEYSSPGSIEGVKGNPESCLLDCPDVHNVGQRLKVIRPGINLFLSGRIAFPVMLAGCDAQVLFHQTLDFPGDFRQGRGAVGGGKLQAVIFGRVMTGSEVDPAVGLAAKYLKSYRRRRRGLTTQK